MDILEALELLKDGKLQDELIRLERLNDELAAQIEIKATLDEVKVLKSKAESDRGRAAQILLEAHAEAELLHTKMVQERQALDAHCRVSMTKVADEHAARVTERQLASDALRARETELLRQQGLLADRAARVKEKEDWIEQTAKEYRERAARLKEFASQV